MCFFLIPMAAAGIASLASAAGATGVASAAAGVGAAAAANMGALTAAGGLLSVGASAAGSIMAGQQQAAAVRANAQAMSDAASRSLDNAAAVKRADEVKTGQVIGAQQAVLAAGNTSGGSGADLLGNTYATGERSASAILTNVNNQVMGLGAQAGGLMRQAGSAQTSGLIGAGTSILGGAASVGDRYAMWQARQQFGGMMGGTGYGMGGVY